MKPSIRCRLFGHRCRTRQADDGTHYRCTRCGWGRIVFRLTAKETR